MDAVFQASMSAAIASGLERAATSVIAAPCTKSAQYVMNPDRRVNERETAHLRANH
jgi:hypothetical protein